MDKRTSKLIESGQGEGKIFEKSIFIDTVYYKFQISQEFIQDSIPGLKNFSGSLKLQNKGLNLLGKYLELELSDKRVWNVLISSGNFTGGEYRFVMGPNN